MKGLKGTLILAALTGLVAALPAHAQYGSATSKPTFRLEAGGAYMNSSDVRDATHDMGWRIAGAYNLKTPSLLSRDTGIPSVDLSYDQDKSGGNKVTDWGVTYEERVPFSVKAESKGSSPYWGLGVGVYRLKAEAAAIESSGTANLMTTSELTNPGTSESKTSVGARAMIGMDFAKNYYVEASYNYPGKVGGAQLDNIALVLGVQF